MTVAVGASHTMSLIVEPEHTAHLGGNAGVNVLATPTLLQFAEMACGEAVAPALKEGEATVGIRVAIRHLKATPVGMRIWVTATVAEIDRRRYVFNLEGHDEKGAILSGQHERFIVDLEPFLAKIGARVP